MAQPESYRISSVEPQSDLKEVARTLAAHGGGAGFADLALDLILNEVVEQARLATGATGAAVALARAGEMVCRATTGEDAPDLGVRLDTTSGLSGACLQTGKVQLCSDTEADPRVNAEASRRLGVRSILVLPLPGGDGKEPFGILEVFSSRANAFGDRDVNTLQVLARRVAVEKRGAEKVAASLPATDDKAAAPADEAQTAPTQEQRGMPEEEARVPAPVEQSRRRSDIWASVLSVLVIMAAVLLGLLLGWRGAIVRGLQTRVHQQRSSTSPVNGGSGTPAAGADRAGADQASPDQGPASSGSAAQASTPGGATPAEPPTGGLVVTQNGKVIYRLPSSGPAATGRSVRPAASTSAESTSTKSGEPSATRLIHRVEPQYPAEAATKHLQGVVTLDVQIGAEGAVHNIAVVEGDPVLAEAAVQAVRQWRYQPYSVDGRPVEMQTRITVRFTLPPG